MKKKHHKSNYEGCSPTDAILESISDGVFTVDLDWRISSFNRAAEEITGISREEALGKYCSDVFRSSMCEAECPLRQTLETKKPIIGKSGYIINAEGRRIPISISTAVLRTSEGKVIGGAETFRDLSEVETLRYELEARFHIGDLVSRSPLMQRIFEILPAVSASPSTVLICGETGTGKGVLARTIHSLSPQSKGAFVAVNCAALPDTLLESELFGYKAGAFTGAHKDKPGRFALAKGGTIFLDEIADISPALQVRLLRILQERTYEPLGSTKSETTNARVITATNKNLKELMEQDVFRKDLYYRVNVMRIEIPPLRQRKEDLPLLADSFINRFNRVLNKSVKGLSIETLSLLMAYDWQGNIRELENVIERSMILCDEGYIEIGHLPPELTSHNPKVIATTDIKTAQNISEAQTIQNALERNAYNRLSTARELGIHKTTLFRKMKKLNIPLPDKDGRSNRKQRLQHCNLKRAVE